MANQPESAVYDAGIYQIETTDPVQGGVGGIINAPLKGLANRTAWLKQQVDALGLSKFDKTGGEITGNVTIKKATPTLVIDAAGSTVAGLRFLRDGVLRWALQSWTEGDPTLYLNAFDSAGAAVGAVLSINNSNRQITISGSQPVVLPDVDPSTANHAATKSYVDAQRDTRVAKTGDVMTGSLTTSQRVIALGGVQFDWTGGGNHAFKLAWENDSYRLPIYVDGIGVGNAMLGHNVVAARAQDWGGSWSLVVRQSDNANIVFFVDAFSDARLKTNVAPTEVDALAALRAVDVVQFDWTEEGAAKARIPASATHANIGVIAQQIEAHLPEVVATPTAEQDAEQIKRLNEGRALPYLIRAIQQLAERVESLEERLADAGLSPDTNPA